MNRRDIKARLLDNSIHAGMGLRFEAAREIEELRTILAEIRDEDWVENCLDPQRPARIAKAALEARKRANSAPNEAPHD